MIDTIKRLLNNVGDSRAILALRTIMNILLPNGDDVDITAHSGGGQADAFVLKDTTIWHEVTAVAVDADSVVLPAARVGAIHFIKNSDSTQSLQVFAPTPDTINSVATGTGVAQTAGVGTIYVCIVAGNYVTF